MIPLRPSQSPCSRRAAARGAASINTRAIAARGAASLAAAVAVLLALCAGLLFGTAPAAATVEGELDQTRSKINEANQRKGVLTEDIQALSGRISVLEGEIGVLRQREAAVQVELDARQAELDAATAQLKRAIEELDQLKVRLHGSLKELSQRLVAIYRTGEPDLVSLILSSEGFDDLVQRAEFMSRIQAQDESVVGRVRDLRDQTRNLVESLRLARERIEAARDAIAAKERELSRTRASIEGQKFSLVAVQDERQAVLDSVESEVADLEKVESSLQQRLEQQIADASGLPAPGPIGDPSAAGLIWPANGLFTSPFGYRWGRMHEGIDISLVDGTALRAAASGTVILAAYTGGYGNYICIDHGGSLSTCYAHLSSFAVSSGSSVSQGSVIGYSGNTGNSTGPHLHFEVRENGVAQDPMGYL